MLSLRTRCCFSFPTAVSLTNLARGGLLAALSVACSAPPENGAEPAPVPGPFASPGPTSSGPQGAAGSGGASGSAGGAAAPSGGGGASASNGADSGGAAGTPAAAGSGGGPAATLPTTYAPTGTLSALCPAGTAFCEDFEDDALDAAPQSPWSDATNGASARVDATRAFSGGRALRVNVPSGAPPHRGYVALQQGSFSAANREMFGRVMVWLEATPLSPAGQGGSVHWTLFQGEGRAATNNYNAIYRFGGEQQGGAGLMANYETTQDGNPPVRSDCYQHSQSAIPVQRWACFEWHFSQAQNEAQYWLDGSELSDIHVIDRGQGCRYDEPPLNGEWLAPPAFQTLYMGWEQYQASSNTLNVWLDGVVVSTSRVGCPAAP
jgi:hypothetical protein